jgi:ATP-dependent helicase HepA
MRFSEGQRWISEPEPELGLGIVLEIEPGRVKLFFPASNAIRLYAEAAAPLRRIRFKIGDTVHSHEGEKFVVAIVNERSDGVITYGGSKGERIVETQLSDILTWDKPGDRIAGAQVDESADFEMRLRALEIQNRILQSPVYGFTGARIDLIPHQLAIAREVTQRQSPRVLLADEVGLGKTIEACLILHRLHLTGKAERILILVPEALVHQWFVELLRRFNLRFAIYDEGRCASLEENNPTLNPFLDEQLILAPLGWLAPNETRRAQLAQAGWNLLIVDEAHHLAWRPDAPSPEYTLVESLAQATPGLLLLTATPQQLGPEGHFARLRLLDPERFPTLEAFQDEAKEYAPIAQIAGKLADGKKLTAKEAAKLAAMPGRICQHWEAFKGGDETARQRLLDELIDQHGTGRAIFRNTRAVLTGFPKRTAKLVALEGDISAAQAEFRGEPVALKKDPRVTWLLSLLKKLKKAKALLICSTREKAEALEAAVREHVNLPTALFHENLTLLQRDRNAAYFAEEDGAQLLICSEIGSEGRNFQFAHHLVLFDLPENPELLEQRIGRLDRIGQSAPIQIHVPYVEGGPYALLARWYHEGLNAFEENLHGGSELFERFREPVRTLALGGSDAGEPKPKKRGKAAKVAAPSNTEAIEALIAETQAVHEEVCKRLAAGEDRLLQLHNRRTDGADVIADAIRAADADTALDDFMLEVFDRFGATVEDIAPRTWIVTPGAELGEGLPGIPKEGITLTADRQRALSRDDVSFLTWDHPAVGGALELLLGTTKGNAALAVTDESGPESVFLEAVHVLEVVAPAELHVSRFLPATPLRIVLDNRLAEPALPFGKLLNGPLSKVLGKTDLCYKLMPKMIEAAAELAQQRAMQIVAASLAAMEVSVGGELARLRDLQAVNPNVTEKEIEAAQNHFYDLRDHLADARVRLDSVRLIFRP